MLGGKGLRGPPKRIKDVRVKCAPLERRKTLTVLREHGKLKKAVVHSGGRERHLEAETIKKQRRVIKKEAKGRQPPSTKHRTAPVMDWKGDRA